MKKNRKITLILLFIAYAINCFAQQPPSAKYVIITFVEKWKITDDAPRYYYWIILQDSVKADNSAFFSLDLGAISKNNFNDCCSGKDINPYIIHPNDHYDDFDKDYYKNLEQLEQIITRNRKKVQVILKKWETGQQEEITIFATPVSGKFCSANLDKFGQYGYGYKGKIYIPYSSFSYAPEFWDVANAKFVLHQDFEKIKFNVFPD